ncbi:MAG: GTPase ObgE [Oscillospiraceae bacterium]|jgi:GTP-binding protein|nr:GTPase ObgE [Oscillospiraceae bacterium]
MATDIIDIHTKAGNGGNGSVSFHREKYVMAGGPDGGDGGRGGDVFVVTNPNVSTLDKYRYTRKFRAENGEDGQSKLRYGKKGDDITLVVPPGTVIRDTDTGAVIVDLTYVDSLEKTDRLSINPDSKELTYALCRGGTGGQGNKHFANSVRQAPRFAKAGRLGEEKNITLELKLIADAGLIGYPNAGKSTLLSALTKARPKIANYHFTTLFPNLGIVQTYDESFVLADIPGLIEGAAEGIGLGHEFLRHIERCRVLVHIVDVSGSEGRDPITDFRMINEELEKYSPRLATLPQIAVANKMDILPEGSDLEQKFREFIEAQGIPYFAVSGAAHTGLEPMKNKLVELIHDSPAASVFTPDFIPEQDGRTSAHDLVITRQDAGGGKSVWIIDGEWLDRLMRNVNFGEYEQRLYFNTTLEKYGVFNRLRKMGVEAGDTVITGNAELEWE